MMNLAAMVVAAWHIGRFRLLSRLGVATFQQAAEAVSKIGLFFGYRVRQRFYQRLLANCGSCLEVNCGATIGERATRVGNNIWIGPYSYIDLAEIDDQVLIGPHVCVLAGGRHHKMDRLDVPIRLQGNNPLKAVRIGFGAWIGANAVVMADVGEGAVIGAGAVVTKPIPANAIAVGNPARVLRYRSDASTDTLARAQESEVAIP